MIERAARAHLIAFFAVLCICAQDNANQHLDTGASKMMNSADMAFAMNAAQCGMAEVKLGELAVEKAASADVKIFAQRMVSDHTRFNNQLTSIANNESMTLPNDVNVKEDSEYNKLSQLSGPSFDRAYIKGIIKDNEQDDKEFRKEAGKGKDPQLKQFAANTLSILESHLSDAKAIEGRLAEGR